jgi:hypothetical protein
VKIVLVSIISVVAGMGVSQAVFANGQFENRPWQFQTPSERSVRAGLADLQERKKGGFFDGFNTTINNRFDTNIFGDQINCDIQATTLGNSGSNLVDGTAGSPIGSTDAFDTDSRGNTNDTIARLGNASDGVGTGEVLNTQTSTNSPVSSTISNSDVLLDIGEQTANGTNNIDLASSQNNEGASLDASVLNSTACSNPGSTR